MKSLKWLLASLIVVPGLSFALSIAVVDSYKIMEKIGPRIDNKLRTEFKDKQVQLSSQQTALSKRQEKLQRDGAIMSHSERSKLQRDIQVKQREVQRLTREINEDIAFRRNEALDQVTNRINQLIDKIQKEKKYDLIVRKETTLFADQQYDITPTILSRYEKAYPEKG